MRIAFIETLMQLAAEDRRVCLLTGDLGFTVLEKFAAAYPDRFYNVGVAEANMIGVATGLAMNGSIPYVYSIATFASMRGYEQLRNGPMLHRLPVRVVGIGGGFAYGHAGATHYALEDFAIMRVQPEMTVIAPADPAQTRAAVRATHPLPGPVYFRIGKGGDPVVPGLDGRFSPGTVETIGAGREVLVLSTGGITADVVEVARELKNVTVGVVATLNPAPDFGRLLDGFGRVVTVEEHYVRGGLGSLVAEAIAGRGIPLRVLGVRERPGGISGSQAYMRRGAGLDRASIRSALERS